MKAPSLAVLLLISACTACTAPTTPYTWGDVTQELGTVVCDTYVNACGFPSDAGVCAEHVAFHLCEPYMDCDKEVDEIVALARLDACNAVLDTFEYQSNECFLLSYGNWPAECLGVLELRPSDDVEE